MDQGNAGLWGMNRGLDNSTSDWLFIAEPVYGRDGAAYVVQRACWTFADGCLRLDAHELRDLYQPLAFAEPVSVPEGCWMLVVGPRFRERLARLDVDLGPGWEWAQGRYGVRLLPGAFVDLIRMRISERVRALFVPTFREAYAACRKGETLDAITVERLEDMRTVLRRCGHYSEHERLHIWTAVGRLIGADLAIRERDAQFCATTLGMSEAAFASSVLDWETFVLSEGEESRL